MWCATAETWSFASRLSSTLTDCYGYDKGLSQERPHNNALQLTRAPVLQKVRAARHFVPHRAFIICGPSQLNAVLARRRGSARRLPRLLATALWVLSGVSCATEAVPPKDDAVSERDNRVLSSVMTDLVSYRGKDSPVRGPFSPPKPLVFAREPERGEVSVADILYRQEKGPWESLTADQIRGAAESAFHLARRAKVASGQFAFAAPNVNVRGTPESREFNDRLLSAYPPGYSDEQQVAIVRLHIPWSMWHSVVGTYVVISDGESWKVLLRQFVYYL